jgi:hypothetical protein
LRCPSPPKAEARVALGDDAAAAKAYEAAVALAPADDLELLEGLTGALVADGKGPQVAPCRASIDRSVYKAANRGALLTGPNAAAAPFRREPRRGGSPGCCMPGVDGGNGRAAVVRALAGTLRRAERCKLAESWQCGRDIGIGSSACWALADCAAVWPCRRWSWWQG